MPGPNASVAPVGNGDGGGQAPQSLSLERWLQYADANCLNGWTGAIPIGKEHNGRYKDPWVSSRHGWHGVDATPDEFEQMAREALQRCRNGTAGILALGERLPEGVLGIDVDAYDGKNGERTLADWEAQFGALPATYKISARRDGVSGIRLYRVPVGFYPKEAADSGVEFLDRHHRYMAAPPSWHHTGRPYRVILPNEKPSKSGVLPPIDKIPWLPSAYRDGLPLSTTEAGEKDAADAEIAEFAQWYDSGPQPEAVQWIIRATIKSPKAEGTYNSTRDALCWAAREAKGKRFGWENAVEQIHIAAAEAYEDRGAQLVEADFQRLIAYAIGQVRDTSEADLYDAWQSDDWKQTHTNDDDAEDTQEPWERYPLVPARDLAAPAKPMRWLINGVWAEKSAGVTAGHKKTFKSWMMHARALAIASGLPYLDDFDVHLPGPVLFVCAEGGEDAFINRHQVIADRYGIDRKDLGDLGFGAVTRTNHLNDGTFMAAIDHHLDALQPVAVFIDPLYAVHPPDVDNKMLYERGQMLARLRSRIEPYAALDIGDHFNKTAPTRGMDLDHIGYVGMSQWADSWSLQCHRKPYGRGNNRAELDVEFGSRRSGARLYQIDWELERDLSDPMLIAWKRCDWSVISSDSQSASASVPRIETYLQRAALILEHVDDEPTSATKDEVTKHLTTKYRGSGSNRDHWRTTWDTLLSDGTLVKTEIDGWRDYKGSMRRAKLTVYKRGGEPQDHPEMDR